MKKSKPGKTIGVPVILFMILMTACKGDQKTGGEVSKETDQVKVSDAVAEEDCQWCQDIYNRQTG